MYDPAEMRRRNLERIANELGGKTELAKKVDRSPQQITSLVNGKKKMGSKLARILEAKLGLQEGELDSSGDVCSYIPNEEVPPAGFSAVYLWELRLNAGNRNGEPEWEEVHNAQPRWLPDQFFQEYGVRPHQCRRAIVNGNSMEPFIYSNDEVTWVAEPSPEIGCVHIIDGKVYVITIDKQFKIKRLSKTKDGILVVSDNTRQYPIEEYKGSECDRIRVYGRVIHIDRKC